MRNDISHRRAQRAFLNNFPCCNYTNAILYQFLFIDVLNIILRVEI